MAGFTKYPDITAAISAGQTLHSEFQKMNPGGGTAVNSWWRMWVAAGMPAAGAEPATTPGTSYTSAAGSINFPDRSSFNKYISSFEVCNGDSTNTRGTLMLYDRLVGVSVSATVGTVTVNSTALPRYTSGVGVEVWLEVTGAIANGDTFALSSYTSPIGASRAGPAFASGNNHFLNQIFQIPLQAGDTGVISVQNLAVTGTSQGTVNVVLLKPLLLMPFVFGTTNYQEFVLRMSAFPRLFDGASLGMYFYNGRDISDLTGRVEVVYG